MHEPAANPVTTRRRVLAALGAGALTGLAGCGAGGGGSGAETRSPTATATSTDSPTTWPAGGPPDRSEWQVTFADRFEDGSLDTDRWTYGMGGSTHQCPPTEAPDHCWAEDHAWVDGETDHLVLQATDEDPTPDGENDHTMGAVSTDPHLLQEYGYFEARCRMPATTGTLCSFWMLSDFDHHRYRELTFEARGNDDGEAIHGGYYVQDDDGTMHEPATGGWDAGYTDFEGTLHERFHTFAIEWRPAYVAFHIDGTEAACWAGEAVTAHFPGAPMYVILSHGVMEGGAWVGYPQLADFPSHMTVDWVRAWQLRDRV